ncbi:MAG TPA: hypothetical protein VMT64_08125 [Candidatus Binataceae bacterium]|nr:hypothetical protein [Candidatus Binataceae bacterium]
MDNEIATLYQQATTIVTKASFFLNLFRPRVNAADDPSSNVLLSSLVGGVTVGQALTAQLKSPATKPSDLKFSFSSALPTVLSAVDPAPLLSFVGSTAALPFKLIRDVITGTNPAQEFTDFPKELEAVLAGIAKPLVNLPFFLVNQLEVALTVLPTLQMIKKAPGALDNIESALSAYFFAGGYTTIDGEKIAMPSPSQKSGVEFVRNAVRIPLEAGLDIEYDLKMRVGTTVPARVFGNAPTEDQQKKLVTWMKGFADQAESAATSAVEGLVLGAGAAKTNALIGAAAGTAAGTMARKATQQVFLAELEAANQ